MVQEARRSGGGRRAAGRARDRQGHHRGAGAGGRRARIDCRAGWRDGRGRRAARTDHRGCGRTVAPSKATPAPTGRPDQKTSTTAPINAADEEPRPRVPPKADGEPKSKLPADTPPAPSVRKLAAESGVEPVDRRRAPARTAASPRATCWRRSNGPQRRRPRSRNPPPRFRCARRRRRTMLRAKSA